MGEQQFLEETLMILTDKVVTGDKINGFIEDNLLLFPTKTFQLFLTSPEPADVIALYFFYCYTAKWQDTNQPKATDGYVRKGLHMGRTRTERAQRYLIDHGFIERICRKDISGIITGWYIKVNFRFGSDIYSKAVKETALIETSFNEKAIRDDYRSFRDKGEHLNIFQRDKYICAYCGSKVESIGSLSEKGMNKIEIAKYVSENTNKIATIDHIIPIIAGGDNSEDNLVTACLHCNCKKKHNQLPKNKQVAEKLPDACLSTHGKTATNALSNININALVDIKIPPIFLELANLLKSEILRNDAGAKVTEAQIKAWTKDAQLLIERDGRQPELVKDVLLWAQHNDFWIPNILSMGKFRKKFSQLLLQKKQAEKKGNSLGERERSLNYATTKKPLTL